MFKRRSVDFFLQYVRNPMESAAKGTHARNEYETNTPGDKITWRYILVQKLKSDQ